MTDRAEPKYYATKTLMGGNPDTNSRHIYEQPLRVVCIFNCEREPWTEKREQELERCLKALNG